MKLSSLSQTDKIKIAAELDGWKKIKADRFCGDSICPNYSASYDAIIPLIQKQNRKLVGRIICDFRNGFYKCPYYMATPSQLLDALIIATGRAEL